MHTRENPSQRYIELVSIYRQMHVDNPTSYVGKSLIEHIPAIRQMVEKTDSNSILDYGSGKGLVYNDGSVARQMGVYKVRCYDPGVKGHDVFPRGEKFDGVISTDALEHIPEQDVPWVIDEMFAAANEFVFATVGPWPAKKTLPNGENAHACQNHWTWWRDVIEKTSAKYPQILYKFIIEVENHQIKLLPFRHTLKTVTNEHAYYADAD